ncbi:MAG: hypothetical protein V3S55_02020 [Nitrospiraceae bacterium]
MSAPLRRAAELLHQAEALGVVFRVREGEVEFCCAQEQEEKLGPLFRQLKKWRAGIKRLVIARACAAASNAIALWKADSQLRADWPAGISAWLESEEAEVSVLLESVEEPRR